MMKFLVVMMLMMPVKQAEALTITEVRSWYQQAEQKEKVCKLMIDRLQQYSEKNNPLFAGYRACATMMMAKHVFNPFSKLSWFNKGKDLLEASLEKDPANFELRFLRFANQASIPAFLGYNDDIENDKNFLIRELPRLNDHMLKKQVIAFMQQSKYVSKQEKNLIHE